jgi:DNA-binding NarL/FixJ family response regulator
MRIVLADDAALLREGVAALLESAGHRVLAAVGDADALRSTVRERMRAPEPDERPDIVLTDVRMPPGGASDGLVAALDLRQEFPGLPVVVLSAYVAGPYVDRLLADAEGGVGYLLKERVGRVEDFLSSLDVVLAGGVVVDPEVVSHLMGAQARALARLTDREREVLALMAQGLSNAQIADRLAVSAPAVSKHVANIFLKLDLPPGEDNRRVRAVLAWLRAESPQVPAPAVARDR